MKIENIFKRKLTLAVEIPKPNSNDALKYSCLEDFILRYFKNIVDRESGV